MKTIESELLDERVHRFLARKLRKYPDVADESLLRDSEPVRGRSRPLAQIRRGLPNSGRGH